MHQLPIKLGSLPINLVLISNGSVAFVKAGNFTTIFDFPEDKNDVEAIFSYSDFCIGNAEGLCYNVAYKYKEIPDMLAWLQQQNLQEPQGMFFRGF